MKLLKGFMAVALITTALTGSTYAAYVAANQAASTVKDLADVGYTSNKKLTITRAAIDLIFDATNPLDAGVGPSDAVKNAKAFLKGIVDGTVDKFAGASPAEKHAAFLTALDAALAKASPIELDLATAGFNVAAAPVADKIQVGIDAFHAALSPAPVNPRHKLLADAKALGVMKAAEADELERELTTAGTDAALVRAADEKIDALKFGADDLATAIAARVALHEPTGGKFKALGLHADHDKVRAFHEILEAEAASGGKVDPRMTKFATDVQELFDSGILEGDASSPDAIVRTLAALGAKISSLEGMLAQMAGKEGQKLAVVQSGTHARVIPTEHDLGGGQYKGGLN